MLHQVPDSLRRELANVCRACFSGEGVARHGALVAAYRAQFVAELNPEARLPRCCPPVPTARCQCSAAGRRYVWPE